MTSHPSDRPVSALRIRMIEDMTVRGFNANTRGNYIRNVRAFAAFIGRSPGTATAEDLRRFQLHQTQSGMQPPSINSAVSALRFLFTVTLDRPDLARWPPAHANSCSGGNPLRQPQAQACGQYWGQQVF
jgi:site-specific recombinase XerC